MDFAQTWGKYSTVDGWSYFIRCDNSLTVKTWRNNYKAPWRTRGFHLKGKVESMTYKLILSYTCNWHVEDFVCGIHQSCSKMPLDVVPNSDR